MNLFVKTNVSSLAGQIKVKNVNASLNTSHERLSSGLRINKAKDDAAGLQIANSLTSQVNGLNQGNRNANDALALAQTMEGAMDEMTNMLQRIRTLAIQSSNGTNTTNDRGAIQQEVSQLSQEITRIACKTTFGGEKILAGVGGAAGAATANGLVQKDGTITMQVGANAGDVLAITNLSRGFTLSKIANAVDLGGGKTATAALNTNKELDVSSASKASEVLAVIDNMISVVDKQRGNVGVIQRRFESTIRNQANVSTNTADSRSRIRDTDFGEESSNLTHQNIIMQTASSMLTQANMRPQAALNLIK